MGSERRRAPRYPIIAEAKVTDIASETTLSARTSALSLGAGGGGMGGDSVCTDKPGDIKLPLQPFGLAERADGGGGVLVLGVDGVVEAADVGGGEFAGEIR